MKRVPLTIDDHGVKRTIGEVDLDISSDGTTWEMSGVVTDDRYRDLFKNKDLEFSLGVHPDAVTKTQSPESVQVLPPLQSTGPAKFSATYPLPPYHLIRKPLS